MLGVGVAAASRRGVVAACAVQRPRLGRAGGGFSIPRRVRPPLVW